MTLLFFITYIIFQPPSTVIVRKIGPRIHLSVITLLWGATMIGMGFVRNFADLAALRMVLGIFEVGQDSILSVDRHTYETRPDSFLAAFICLAHGTHDVSYDEAAKIVSF